MPFDNLSKQYIDLLKTHYYCYYNHYTAVVELLDT